MTNAILMVVVTAIASATFGWEAAHSTVATECGRLGAFYVGSKTFECKEKK
mgnify:CR=1 FL=1